MRRFALALAILCAALPAGADGPDPDHPRLSNVRLVLHTVAGPLVLAFYPDFAPLHLRQFLRLAKAHALDTTHFSRVVPNFVVQSSIVHDRLRPITDDVLRVLKPVKAEISPVKHLRWRLSMAHGKDQDGAIASFSILLKDQPHLDGAYTVFGELVEGKRVVEEMLDVPRRGSAPLIRLTIKSVEVMSAAQAAHLDAKAVSLSGAGFPGFAAGLPWDQVAGTLTCGIGLLVAINLLASALSERLPRRAVRSMNLLCVLIGAFLLVVVLTPAARASAPLGTLLFLSLLGVLRILATFELPPQS